MLKKLGEGTYGKAYLVEYTKDKVIINHNKELICNKNCLY